MSRYWNSLRAGDIGASLEIARGAFEGEPGLPLAALAMAHASAAAGDADGQARVLAAARFNRLPVWVLREIRQTLRPR